MNFIDPKLNLILNIKKHTPLTCNAFNSFNRAFDLGPGISVLTVGPSNSACEKLLDALRAAAKNIMEKKNHGKKDIRDYRFLTALCSYIKFYICNVCVCVRYCVYMKGHKKGLVLLQNILLLIKRQTIIVHDIPSTQAWSQQMPDVHFNTYRKNMDNKTDKKSLEKK